MAYNPIFHNRQSNRIKNYDYSGKGNYFITICCADRKTLFGEIINGEMILTPAGEAARECWLEIPTHFPHAILEEFIIMPDHVHGLIRIPFQKEHEKHEPVFHEFGKIIPRSIGSMIKGFKIGVTKWFRMQGDTSKIWQRNYHCKIISDQNIEGVNRYIKNNPINWENQGRKILRP